MKLFNAIAVAAVIGTSLIATAPAESRNGWKRAYCDPDDGSCWYTRVISRNYPYVTYEYKSYDHQDKSYDHQGKKEADCQYYKSRWIADYYKGGKSSWKDAMPGSIAEAILDSVCQ